MDKQILFNKKLFALILSAVLAVGTIAPVYADEVEGTAVTEIEAAAAGPDAAADEFAAAGDEADAADETAVTDEAAAVDAAVPTDEAADADDEVFTEDPAEPAGENAPENQSGQEEPGEPVAPEEDVTTVVFSPIRNTTKVTVSIPQAAVLLDDGAADSVRIDAVISYGGKTTRSVSKKVSLGELDAGSSFEMDFGDYGKWSATAVFFKDGAKAHENEAAVVGVTADYYNIAPVSATLPVTFFSLNMWGENSIRESGPTILMMERPSAYDWNALPEGVYAVPYLTREEAAYQPGTFEAAAVHFKEEEQVMADYVRDLLELDPTAYIHLYCVDVYCELVQKIIYANRIPEDQYCITEMSDGTFTFVQFEKIYTGENAADYHAQLLEEWNESKAYAYENGEIDPAFTHEKCKNYIWALVDSEPNAELWVSRKDLIVSKEDGNVFGKEVQGNPKVIQVNIGNLLKANIQGSDQNTVEFKALYNFNDSYFEKAESEGKDAMVFLGTRVTSEPAFEDYAGFVMTYYGDRYVYYYKGHPGTPSDLFPEKTKQLENLGIIDVDASVAAELILFFNPEIYLSGYQSSTYASVPVGMGKGMFAMTKAVGLSNPMYENMAFWMSAVTDETDERVLELCEDGHRNYLVEFSDGVIAEEGYDIAVWDADIPEIRYYRDNEGVYELVGSQGGEGQAAVEPGVYVIGTELSREMVLDVAGGSKEIRANIQLYPYNATDAQKWEVSFDENGLATITNVGSGHVLDAAGGKTDKRTNIQQYRNNGTAAQKWVLKKNENGSIRIVSSVTEKAVFDVNQGKAVKKANVQLYTPNGTAAQNWYFYLVEPNVPVEGQAQLEDGYYTLTGAVDTAFQMQVEKWSAAKNANIQVGTAADAHNQIFKITKTESGYYRIESAWSGFAVTADRGRLIPGTNVLLSDSEGSDAEWGIYKRTGGSYHIRNAASGLMLRVDGRPVNGTNVSTWEAEAAQSQRWLINGAVAPDEKIDALADEHRHDLKDGVYTIYAGSSSPTVFDVKGGSLADKANVQIYRDNKTLAQVWYVSHDEDGYVTIKSLMSGKALDVSGGKRAFGGNVQQYRSNETQAQKWIAFDMGDGTFKIMSALSENLVLDVKGGTLKAGTNVQVYRDNGTDAQRFRFKNLI